METDLEQTVSTAAVKKTSKGKILVGIGILAAAVAAGGYMAVAQPDLSALFEEPVSAEVRESDGHNGYGVSSQENVVEIEVEAFHYGYTPGVIEVHQGDTVRLYVSLEEEIGEHGHEGEAEEHNDAEAGDDHDDGEMGMPEHSFTILSENREYYMFGVNENLYEGETAIIEFTADRAGEFPFVCLVYCGISEDGSEGHHTMKGLLRVLPGE